MGLHIAVNHNEKVGLAGKVFINYFFCNTVTAINSISTLHFKIARCIGINLSQFNVPRCVGT